MAMLQAHTDDLFHFNGESIQMESEREADVATHFDARENGAKEKRIDEQKKSFSFHFSVFQTEINAKIEIIKKVSCSIDGDDADDTLLCRKSGRQLCHRLVRSISSFLSRRS